MMRTSSLPTGIGAQDGKSAFLPPLVRKSSKPLQPRLQKRHTGGGLYELTEAMPLQKTIWRSTGCCVGEQSPVPPLAKGASRHRVPSWAAETRVVARAQGSPMASPQLCDPELAESYGRRILGDDPWPKRVFEVADGSCSGYLSPADWAALTSRLKIELGDATGSFPYDFVVAETSLDGRVDMEEWEAFTALMEEEFGQRRCRIASMRYLGTRKAEARHRVKNIYMFDGYDQDASLRLLMACSKWHSASLLDHVRSALDAKADPNAGLADPRFNDYTPLIFLAMAQPTADGTKVALAIDALVDARADVHRESGQMPFGRLVPLRFAARLQNRQGLEALLQYVDVGDRFSWAAGENVEHVMLDELRKLYGDATCQRIAARSRYSTQATVLLRLFASPIVGGKLTKDGAQKLLDGQFADGNIRLGSKADPDGPGLEGMTALMEVVKKGDLDTTLALLKGKATPLQQDSSGATPLHFASAQVMPEIGRALLDYKADPAMVDQAGFTAWMVAGEAFGEVPSQPGEDGRPCSPVELGEYDPSEYAELMELLKPRVSPHSFLDQVEANGVEVLLSEYGADSEVLTTKLRLHESLFFDPRVIVRGPFEGRFPRKNLLMRVKDLILELLTTDPLQGPKKNLAKYLLQATMGPTGEVPCGHVRKKWSTRDNRAVYRRELMEAVHAMMGKFAMDCNVYRKQIERKAEIERLGGVEALQTSKEHQEADSGFQEPGANAPLSPVSEGPASPTSENAFGDACLALCSLPADEVAIPKGWQEADKFWSVVQERQVLRYDPPWAHVVASGASCSLQLLRLGAVADLAECSALQQVHHASMEEQLARGYVAYSELCNAPFQERVKAVAAKVAGRQGLDVTPPEHLVPAKKLKRLMEKTREAREERGDLQWPGCSESYLRFAHCFHILDTVRTAFVCGGSTLGEQVACCMELVKALEACTAEKDGLCVLRRKSGFAAGVQGCGGYADVKLLMYANLGVHRAFDEAEVPLQIVGEVQIVLRKYMDVKQRMHLVYEVSRGSFDRKGTAGWTTPDSPEGSRSRGAKSAQKALRKLRMIGLPERREKVDAAAGEAGTDAGPPARRGSH